MYKKIFLLNSFKGKNDNEKFAIYRDLWDSANSLKVLTDFPLHLDIELSSVCNLSCKFCFQKDIPNSDKGLMDESLFKKIIDEGVSNGLSAIKLQVRGESFLHPKIFEFIEYAKEKGVLDIQVTTNGTFLDDEKIEKILNSKLNGLIISIDFHHTDSINEKSTNNLISSIDEGLIKLLDERRKLGKKNPWVRLQTILSDNDLNRKDEIIKELKTKFVDLDYVSLNTIIDLSNDTDSYPDLHINYKICPCQYLFQRLTIFWTGEVTTCCLDYNNIFKLGNLKEKSIKDIWLSEKMDEFRKLHLKGMRSDMEICKHCHVGMEKK